jgi:hypothetical protein
METYICNTIETKVCCDCLEQLTLTNFPRDDYTKKNGEKVEQYRSRCKTCYNESRPDYKKSTEPAKCIGCEEVLPASKFKHCRTRPSGLNSRCNKCQHLEKLKYLSSDPRVFIKDLYTSARARAIKGGGKQSSRSNVDCRPPPLLFDMTFQEWMDVYYKQEGLCGESGIKMKYNVIENYMNPNGPYKKNIYNISPDQIVPGKGYTKENLQFVCAIVNQMKSDLPTETFRDMCGKIHLKSLSAV